MSAGRRSTKRLLALALAFALPGSGAAFENGPPPANTGGFGETDCSACHFDNDINGSDGRLSVSGLPAVFVPGEHYAITLALDHPALIVAGFQLSVRTADGEPAGMLVAHASDVGATELGSTRVTYMQHNRPRATTDGHMGWVLVWHAPDDEVAVVVNVAAVAANDDASPLGDYVYTTSAGTAASEALATTVELSGAADASSPEK